MVGESLDDFKLKNLIVGILNLYYEENEIEIPVPLNISIVEDMTIAYEEVTKTKIVNDNLNRFNGFTIPPSTIHGVFNILLNKNVLMESVQNNNANWIGTIIHEATHANDFCQFAKMIQADNYDDITNLGKNAMFQLWTEFHARLKGYYYVRKYSFENMFDEKQIPDIIDRELPYQDKYMYNTYHSTANGYEQAYCVSHYIGRLCALNIIFPETFNDSFVKDKFGTNDWMYKWYKFLSQHLKLEEAVLDFEEMREILSENFIGI